MRLGTYEYELSVAVFPQEFRESFYYVKFPTPIRIQLVPATIVSQTFEEVFEIVADSLPTTEKIPLAEEVLELTLAEIVTEFGQLASDYENYTIQAESSDPNYSAAVNFDQLAGILTLGPFTSTTETIEIVVTVSNTIQTKEIRITLEPNEESEDSESESDTEDEPLTYSDEELIKLSEETFYVTQDS